MTATIIDLPEGCFQRALDSYIDYNKPDPLVRRQMQAWQFEWQKTAGIVETSTSFEPTHVLAGNLIWRGEYLELTISTICYWKGDKKDGSIHFCCEVVKGELTEFNSKDIAETEIKARRRTHSKMKTRLRDDDYVCKLLSPEQPQSLIETTVTLSSNGDLEERVYCDEIVAEAIRRGIFTTGESSLDVFEVIVALPILPGSTHKVSEDEVNSKFSTTSLADRVKLRCLEEATFDACEQQEEAEIVDDLQISKKTKKA